MNLREKSYFITAWLCVILGIIGIFLPLLPTTPFLLAAAFCFGKSSPRFYRWLTSNAYLNAYLENYRSRCGVPRKIIFRSLIFLWLTLGLSSLLWSNVCYWIILAVVGAAVTIHLLMLKRSSDAPRQFTLLELLISLGVIALLSGMLLPVLARARDSAKSISCASNLKQIGLTLEYYANDNADMIPNVTGNIYQAYSIPIIKMYGGVTFALGKLIEQYQLPPEFFGCPCSPERNPEYVRRNWNAGGVVQTAYVYRETDVAFQPRKSDLKNTNKAVLMDFACISASGLRIIPHNFREVNILYNDGRVVHTKNTEKVNEYFTISTPSASTMVPSCDLIWQHADAY